MDWFDVFKEHVIWAEGRRNDVYLDSKGIPTVGIGHNLRAHPRAYIIPEVGFTISDERVDQLFDEDSKDAIKMVRHIFQYQFDSWTGNRKAMVVDLMFNMGASTFLSFGPTIDHLRAGEWEDVAQHLEKSAWYKQVKRRGKRVVELIRQG